MGKENIVEVRRDKERKLKTFGANRDEIILLDKYDVIVQTRGK